MYPIRILLTTFIFGIISAEIVVTTNSGPIQGIPSSIENVNAFLGIPYAEPPIGELRFAKPMPKKNWSVVYSATKLPPPCPQFGLEPHYYFMPDTSNMSEDCLYLNIWAPKSAFNEKDSLKPVVIFIHPGGFVTGSSNLGVHDGSRFASRGDIVVATINYRLGSFGFLLANIEEANGNMGIYDQIMAIKWIKENAIYFGGDAENIVLMGASAGAYSISAHMISPLAKNLFKKAILQGGTMVNPLFMYDNTFLIQNSKTVAAHLGCTNETTTLDNDPQAVVKCLKLKPKEAFVEAEKIISASNTGVFYPRINDEFLPKGVVKLFREGKFKRNIDVMLGFTKEEGTLLLMAGIPEFFGNYGRNLENNLSKNRVLMIGRTLLMVAKQSNTSEILQFYLKQVKNPSPLNYAKILAGVIGDFAIACGSVFLADFLTAKGNSVYFYQFSFRPVSTPLEEWIGTTHLDELQYIFGNPFYGNFTSEEIELSHRLMDRWSAFAKTGNPNIPQQMPWFRYSYDQPLYIDFGQEEETIRMKPNSRCDFWRKRFDSEIDSDLIHFLQNSE